MTQLLQRRRPFSPLTNSTGAAVVFDSATTSSFASTNPPFGVRAFVRGTTTHRRPSTRFVQDALRAAGSSAARRQGA